MRCVDSSWQFFNTGILLQVKTSVLYPHHYHHEVVPGKVQTFLRHCQEGVIINFNYL